MLLILLTDFFLALFKLRSLKILLSFLLIYFFEFSFFLKDFIFFLCDLIVSLLLFEKFNELYVEWKYLFNKSSLLFFWILQYYGKWKKYP